MRLKPNEKVPAQPTAMGNRRVDAAPPRGREADRQGEGPATTDVIGASGQ